MKSAAIYCRVSTPGQREEGIALTLNLQQAPRPQRRLNVATDNSISVQLAATNTAKSSSTLYGTPCPLSEIS